MWKLDSNGSTKCPFLTKNDRISSKNANKSKSNELGDLEYGLKWSQASTLADPWCFQTFSFQNFGMEGPKFWLLAKNGAPKSGEQVY